MKTKTSLVLASAVALQAGAAFAQTAPGAPGTNQVIPEKDRSLPNAEPKGGEPLTDLLQLRRRVVSH